MSAAQDVNRARYAMPSNRGLSLETTVAFGPHGAIAHFHTLNETDEVITGDSTVVVHSGGQYLEGTTEVTRTRELLETNLNRRTANVIRVFPSRSASRRADGRGEARVHERAARHPQLDRHEVSLQLEAVADRFADQESGVGDDGRLPALDGARNRVIPLRSGV